MRTRGDFPRRGGKSGGLRDARRPTRPTYNAWCWLTNPPLGTTANLPPDVTTGKLWPYIKNKQVYLCPDDPQNLYFGLQVGSGFSYGNNAFFGGETIIAGNVIKVQDSYHPAWPLCSSRSAKSNIPKRCCSLPRPATSACLRARGIDGRLLLFCPMPVCFNSKYQPPNDLGGAIMLGNNTIFRFSNLHSFGSRASGCSVRLLDGHAIFGNMPPTFTRK